MKVVCDKTILVTGTASNSSLKPNVGRIWTDRLLHERFPTESSFRYNG